MNLLYGTYNPAKLESMIKMLDGLDICITGLRNANMELKQAEETGKDPLSNATQKAISYFHQIRKPLFSCDSELYFEGVDEKDQPGVLIKQAYNNHAHERKDEVQEWKVGPRNKFLNFLKKEGKKNMLDIGAGNGRDSKFFMDNGFQVIATDLSDEMVKICKTKGIEAYEIDYYNLSHMNKTFDAIWAMNCLLHVRKADLEIVLEEIDKVLSPSGLFFMGIYGGEDKEGIWEEDIYTPHRFFSFYSDKKLRDILIKYFDLVSFDRIETGGKYYNQTIILRKR